MGVIQVSLIEWLLVLFLFLLCIAIVLFIVLKIWQRTNGSWFELAFLDDLTRVYNQNAYRRKIRKLKVSSFAQTWLVLFDIDDFKRINDLQGHLHGDQTLVSAARRLRAVFLLRSIKFIESAAMSLSCLQKECRRNSCWNDYSICAK